jgi:hypothetical protein
MNAVVKLTGYAKATELLETIVTIPASLVPFARTVAGAPETDPGVLALYPLTVPQAEAIASEAELPWTLIGSTIVWRRSPRMTTPGRGRSDRRTKCTNRRRLGLGLVADRL